MRIWLVVIIIICVQHLTVEQYQHSANNTFRLKLFVNSLQKYDRCNIKTYILNLQQFLDNQLVYDFVTILNLLTKAVASDKFIYNESLLSLRLIYRHQQT